MKRIFILAVIMAMVLGVSVQAHAALSNLGTDSLGNRLIYDSDLNITWYDYSTWGSWQNQVNWASALSVDFGGNVYDDWRLPSTVDGPYVFGYDGTTTGGYNITSSEMGHLFYTELGNKGYYDTSGNWQFGWGLTNKGDFQHLLRGEFYWSGTEYAANPLYAWFFFTDHGNQHTYNKFDTFFALAVRPGLAVVPEPISSILFLSGGAAFGVKGYMKRRRPRE